MVEAGGKDSSGVLVGMKKRVARMGGAGEASDNYEIQNADISSTDYL